MIQAPSRTRGFVALGLVVAFVVSAVLSGIFVYRQAHLTDKPFSLSNSGTSLEADPDVSKVKAVAEQFSLRMDSLGSKDIAGYFKSVRELLTTRCQAELDKTTAALTNAVGSVPFTTTGYIRATGIASIDRDSAVVLIVHDANKMATGATQGLATQNRWTVKLAKVAGSWLVDGFTDPDHGGEIC